MTNAREEVWGWKAIAARLGVSKRTAERYADPEHVPNEADRLPVMKCLRSGQVFIMASALEAWRTRGFVPLQVLKSGAVARRDAFCRSRRASQRNHSRKKTTAVAS